MKIKPLNDWAVIVPDEAENRTASGIFIPDSAQNRPAEGIVEAIGPGAFEERRPERDRKEGKKERKFVPTTVKPGDHVCYEKYAGRQITVGEVEYVLVRERSILGLSPDRPVKHRDDPPPLRFPLVPVAAEGRALVKRAETPVALADQHRKAALRPAKPAGKAAKKSVKKSAKTAAKKRAKKSSAKTAKRTVQKTAKRTPKKRASKPAAKATRRPAAGKTRNKRS